VFQERLGPNRVGPWGLFQVLADTLKILFKEDWTPPFVDKPIFIIAPMIIMTATLFSFAAIPFAPGIAVTDLNIGILFFLGMSSISVYGVVLAGWASNSKYPLFGALRAAGQMFGYEVFMGLALMGVVMLAGSFNLGSIVEAQKHLWFCVTQPVGLVIFIFAGLAETRRAPFDLPESENELVAGFHTEYSGMKFGMFFIGEYVGVVLISSLITVLYFGGWFGPGVSGLHWFMLKTFFFICMFILFRAAFPRPRWDQLMMFGWGVLLPVSLLNLLVTGAIVLAQGGK
jgi:NADH-quinone oxidoreductase subunit H